MCLEIFTFYGRLTVPEHHFKHCCFFVVFFCLLNMLGADMRCFALAGESFVQSSEWIVLHTFYAVRVCASWHFLKM